MIDVVTAAAGRLGPFVTVESVQGFIGNETFRVRTRAGDTYHVKSGAATDAEVRACRLARAAGVPAPDIVADGPGYLVQREVEGRPVSATDASQVLPELGRQLVKLHAGPADGYGLLGGPLRSTWAEVLLDAVRSLVGISAAGVLPDEHRRRLGALVEQASDELEPARPALLHGDLHPRHVYALDGELTAIIDWGDALYGDPLFDLGRFSLAGGRRDERRTGRVRTDAVGRVGSHVRPLPGGLGGGDGPDRVRGGWGLDPAAPRHDRAQPAATQLTTVPTGVLRQIAAAAPGGSMSKTCSGSRWSRARTNADWSITRSCRSIASW